MRKEAEGFFKILHCGGKSPLFPPPDTRFPHAPCNRFLPRVRKNLPAHRVQDRFRGCRHKSLREGFVRKNPFVRRGLGETIQIEKKTKQKTRRTKRRAVCIIYYSIDERLSKDGKGTCKNRLIFYRCRLM